MVGQVDRVNGLVGTLGVKAPCRAASTGNLPLSGEQTVDGVALVAWDRVLVKDQTTASENGIYDVQLGAWTRSADFNGPRDVMSGTTVPVGAEGTTNEKTFWFVATTGAIVPGTTSLTFEGSALNTPVGDAIHTAGAEATLLSADEFGFWNSVTGLLSRITYANMLVEFAADLVGYFAALAGSASQVFSVGAATADAHAVGAKQLQTQALTAFTTAGTDTAFTLTTTNAPALTTGERWFVTFNAAPGATPTLNRDAKGAKSLKYRDSAGAKQAITATQVPSGWSSDVVYDGTDYVVLYVVKTSTADFESSQQTITSAGALTIAHGIGAIPSDFDIYLVCQTGEAGYTAGDILLWNFTFANQGADIGKGVSIVPDATNLNIRFGSYTYPFYTLNKSTGAIAQLTNANWKIVFKAWR